MRKSATAAHIVYLLSSEVKVGVTRKNTGATYDGLIKAIEVSQ
jgi:hypothetical protein